MTRSRSASQRAATAPARLGRDHDDHADAAVEGAQHLALRDAAGRASQPKTGGTWTALEIDRRRETVRAARAPDIVGRSRRR